MEVGFGLTNGFWDIVWDTRIPEAEREGLYAGMHRQPPAPQRPRRRVSEHNESRFA